MVSIYLILLKHVFRLSEDSEIQFRIYENICTASCDNHTAEKSFRTYWCVWSYVSIYFKHVTNLYVCVYVCVGEYGCVYVYIGVCICIYVYAYMCVYACVCVFI